MGNIFEFDIKDPKKYLTAWREKFGKIFSFSLMGQKVVVVSVVSSRGQFRLKVSPVLGSSVVIVTSLQGAPSLNFSLNPSTP